MAPVYGVHAIKKDEITATMVIYESLTRAEDHARQLSTDPGVLAGAVTQYGLNEAGRRTAVALYVEGVRQERPHVSNNRQIFSSAHGPLSAHS